MYYDNKNRIGHTKNFLLSLYVNTAFSGTTDCRVGDFGSGRSDTTDGNVTVTYSDFVC